MTHVKLKKEASSWQLKALKLMDIYLLEMLLPEEPVSF
jgi:hypothetical protein